MKTTIALLVLSSLSHVACVDVSGHVIPAPRTAQSGAASVILGAIPEMSPTRVMMDGGAREAIVSPLDNSFLFENVDAGQHVIDVVASDAGYASVVVDVSDRVESAVEYHYAGASGLPARLPLTFAPLMALATFDAKPPSMLWGMANNPMVIFGGVALLLMLFVQSQDPEEMKAA